ncbi:MAG: DUF502 domain-containing protein [Sumerlaeia bacterium]
MSPLTENPENTSSESNPKHGSVGTFREMLRRRFLAGLIVVVPVSILVFAIGFSITQIDNLLGERIRGPVTALLQLIGWPERLAHPISIAVSIILLFGIIIVIGALTRFLIFRQLITLGEFILSKIPFLSFFYNTPKEVVKLLTENTKTQKRIVLVQYPKVNTWVLAYATSEFTHEPTGQTYITTFIPTTPNPTSGFLLLYTIEEVFDINLTTEDAVRMIISGGILSPETYHTAPFSGLHKKPNPMPPCPPLTVEHNIETKS